MTENSRLGSKQSWWTIFNRHPDGCTGTRADMTDITREARDISESENTQATVSV